MVSLRNIVEYIHNFFTFPLDNPRKRRAADTTGLTLPKHRKTMNLNSDFLEDDWFMKRDIDFRKSPRINSRLSTKQQPRIIDTVILNDDDDICVIKKSPLSRQKETSKYTSTPAENRKKNTYLNGNANNTPEDDDVSFVKHISVPSREKAQEASNAGFKYLKPTLFNIGSHTPKPKEKNNSLKLQPRSMRPSLSRSPSLNYSFRLNDKLQYQKLIENHKDSSNDSSIFQTPASKLFGYDTANQTEFVTPKSPLSRQESVNSTNGTKERLSTRETLKKVLDNFEEPVIVKDSDSESDVVLVAPPSPKPDIKVDRVNSLKTVIDTSKSTNRDWLDDLVARHRKNVKDREKEVQVLIECSKKHNTINKDMGLEILRNKVKKCLQIKDAVLPEVEEEPQFPVLTQEHLQMVASAFGRGDPGEILASKFNLNITRRDIQTLGGLNWLNDEVINFYMNMIIERAKNSKWPKSYAFNTFFYPKLLRDGPQSLRRWTKKVDLFSFDIVCVPIHLGMHWCMAIIDFQDRSIRYYDSMGSANFKCLDALRNYLEAEHMDKKKRPLDTSNFHLENMEEIPQQMNGSDCGVFACTFAEFITRKAKITFKQEDMPYVRKKMVVEIMSGELLIK